VVGRTQSRTAARPTQGFADTALQSCRKPSCTTAAGINLLQSESPQLNVMDQHEFIDMEVVLDSGAADHVIDKADAPDYELKESAGSRAGACFVAANGERIPNQGEVQLQLKLGTTPIASTFQVSQISRPLWSVGKICDAGYTVVFKKDGAEILHVASGAKIGDFSRRQGLYVGDFKLRNPSLFKRQGR
jgi:hypothetical protein